MDKIRVTLALPLSTSSGLLTLIGTLQQTYGSALDVDIRHIKVADLVAPTTLPTAAASSEPAEAAAAPAVTTAVSGAKVAYQVVPTAGAWRPHTVPERVRTFLLANGPHTANEVAMQLGITRHSAESAIHMLRSNGYVRTIEAATIRQSPDAGLGAVEQE